MSTAIKQQQDQARQEQRHLADLAEHVLASAKKAGVTAASVNLNQGAGLSVEVRLGEVDVLEYHRDQGMGITVWFGQRKGAASSADFSEKAVQDSVAAACRIAKYTSKDPFTGLAEADLMATDLPDLDLYHPSDLEADEAIRLATACEQAALDCDPRISNSDGGAFSRYAGTSLYANTHGFVGQRSGTRYSMNCTVVAQENDSMQRDYWYDLSCDPARLASAESIGQKAGERTVRRLHAKQIKTGKFPVIFAPEVAQTLIGAFLQAINGRSLYLKTSFLLDTLGERIFPEFVSIHEQPLLPRVLGSSAYDQEGVATQTRDLVRDGIVQGYILGSYSARKLGMQTTGNAGGTHNVTVESTGQDRATLLKMMGKGILVTDLIGHGVNIVNGDYSQGAAGFWVENGEIQYPIEEITVAGNLKTMFQGIQALGSDIDTRGGIRTGSVLIDEMMVAGA